MASAVRMVGLMRPYAREMAEKTLVATEGADLILCSTLTAPNYHTAQGRGIPSMGVFLQPLERTREFSSVLTGGVRSYGSWGNRMSAAASEALLAVPFMGEVNRARIGMGLPAISYRQLRRDLADQRWPVMHGFSRHLVPRPADWRPGLEVVGYWWSEPDPSWTPSEELVDFLAAGDPPVLLGFGSMAAGTGDAERLAEVAVTALRDVGVRGILQAGWSGLEAQTDGRGDILSIGEAPHDWLLPRVAAVVHHGGAGTTAAAVHHGVPGRPGPCARGPAVLVGAGAPRGRRRGADPVHEAHGRPPGVRAPPGPACPLIPRQGRSSSRREWPRRTAPERSSRRSSGCEPLQ